jgi:putative FmdB family regulatory protein
MPTYAYKCHACRSVFEVRHGMFFEDQRCVKCSSEDVQRMPSEISIGKQTDPIDSSSTKKTGQVVDKFIEDTKKEIKKEKSRLKSEEI